MGREPSLVDTARKTNRSGVGSPTPRRADQPSTGGTEPVIQGAVLLIAALFLFHRLRWGDVRVAVSSAASSIHGLLRRTAEAGSREILTVAAQDEFVRPSQTFVAEPC